MMFYEEKRKAANGKCRIAAFLRLKQMKV